MLFSRSSITLFRCFQKSEKVAMGILPLRAGDAVEVCRDEEGLKGAWYPATLIRKRSPQYEIELKSKARDKSKCRVGADEIRPAPPLLFRQHFVADEIVDAHDKDGWWIGTIENALPDNNYLVYFTHSQEKVEYHVSQLRLHLDWVDGIWLQPSQLPSEKTVSISPDQPERENAAEEISAAAERVGDGDGDAAESERSKGKDKVEVEVEDGSSGRGTIGRDVEWGKSHSSAPHANVSSSKQAQVPISQAKLAQVEAETPLNAAANPTLKKPSEKTVSISPEPERENAAEGISATERVGDAAEGVSVTERVGDAAESERKRRKRSKGKDKAEVEDGSSGRGTMNMNMNTAGSGRDVEGAKSVTMSHSSAPRANVSSSKQTRVPISQAKLEQVENVLHGEAETTLDAAANPTLKKIQLHAFDSVLFFN